MHSVVFILLCLISQIKAKAYLRNLDTGKTLAITIYSGVPWKFAPMNTGGLDFIPIIPIDRNVGDFNPCQKSTENQKINLASFVNQWYAENLNINSTANELVEVMPFVAHFNEALIHFHDDECKSKLRGIALPAYLAYVSQSLGAVGG